MPEAQGMEGGVGAFLGDALKGVVAPTPPEIQRIASPSAPQPGNIQGGQIAALLQLLLGGGAPAAPLGPGVRLNQAVRG